MRPLAETLPRTWDALERFTRSGAHSGGQLAVWLRGTLAVDAAWGEARPGEPMRTDHLLPWLSSGKPLTAVAVARQWERDRLDLDQPLAAFIPAFAAHGKGDITIRHLLTHTTGCRPADRLPDTLGWDGTIEAICSLPPEPGWVPGAKAGYSTSAAWFLLGELVQRLDGRPYARSVREEILLPLGLEDTWIGMPAERHSGYGARIAPVYRTDSPRHRRVPILDTPATCTTCRPGGGARGPIRDLARFYQALLDGGDRLLRPETVRHWTRRHREGMFDHTFLHPIDFGLGFILNSRRHGPDTVPYGYGPFALEDTFGHGGAQSSCAFADPGHGLVVAWICNGQPGESAHQERARAINRALYEDLHLAFPWSGAPTCPPADLPESGPHDTSFP